MRRSFAYKTVMEEEAKARIKMDRLFEKADWRLLDDEDGSANVAFEANVKIRKQDVDDLGEGFEKNTFL